MMQGFVNATYEAALSVVVRHERNLLSVDALIDTGFTGFLSLPSAFISELELPWTYRDRATLGDGRETVFDIYTASIIWDGKYREIEINAAETEPLLGMSLSSSVQLN